MKSQLYDTHHAIIFTVSGFVGVRDLEEFSEAVWKMLESPAERLVIDLRRCERFPCTLLTECVVAQKMALRRKKRLVFRLSAALHRLLCACKFDEPVAIQPGPAGCGNDSGDRSMRLPPAAPFSMTRRPACPRGMRRPRKRYF
jgi:hypothetical protein